MPRFYSNFGSDARSTINDDYELGHKFRSKANVSLPALGFTNLTGKGAEKGGVLSGSLEARSKVQGFPVKLTGESNGNGSLELSVPTSFKGLDLAVIANTNGLAKIRGKYRTDIATLKLATKRLANGASAHAGVSVDLAKGLAAAASTRYCLKSGSIVKHQYALGYKNNDFEVHAALEDKQDTVKFSFFHNVRPDLRIAALLDHTVSSGANLFTIGGRYKLDGGDVLKAKLNSEGVLSLAWATEFYQTQKGTPLFGLAVGTQIKTKELNTNKYQQLGFHLTLNL